MTQDRSDFLDRLLALFDEHEIRYCVIGGQGVNAYTPPLVSLDLDLVVAVAQLAETEALLRREFTVEVFPHSLNVAAPGSDLRVQIQTDPRYAAFVERATLRPVLDIALPVAHVEDLLQGKIWAALDPARCASKRLKDITDIARLLEAYPELRSRVPEPLLERMW